MPSIYSGIPSRNDRKRCGEELRRRRKSRWDNPSCRFWFSSSPTLPSLRLEAGEITKKARKSRWDDPSFRFSSLPSLSSDDNFPALNDHPHFPPLPPSISSSTRNRQSVTPPITIIDDNPFLNKNPNNNAFITQSPPLPSPLICTNDTPENRKKKIAGPKDRCAFPPLHTELLKSKKIDHNKVMYHSATNKFESNHVIGVFPTIDFSTDKSFANQDNKKLPPTPDTEKNDLNEKKWCNQDNVDVCYTKYVDNKVINERKPMLHYLKKNLD